MIKVCHLTSVHKRYDTRIFVKQCTSLVQAGYDVTLIVADGKEYEEKEGVKIIDVGVSRFGRIGRMTRTVMAVYKKALNVNADIYHFHDPELIPIGLLLKRHAKRVIYDVHEDVPRQNMSKPYIPVMLRKPVSAIIEALENISAGRFDGVVTATPFINKRFLRLGANAVNVNNFPIASELCPAENQWGKKEEAVCYIGGIAGIRGAFEMVDAIGKTGYRLLMAGNIESGIESKLRRMPGWRRVEALGFVNREGVRTTVARSMGGLVLLHATINYLDALPVKMFEYMSAGIPVIASNFPLWKEIVEGSECGICVDPLDSEEIAKAIRWIIEHPNEARQMGENGRRAVEKRYNWENEERKLLALYREILERSTNHTN